MYRAEFNVFDIKAFLTVSKQKNIIGNQCSFVDPDPDLVGSASFCRIRIGVNSKHLSFIFFHEKFKTLS
jgi:hypothetical protein